MNVADLGSFKQECSIPMFSQVNKLVEIQPQSLMMDKESIAL